MLYILRARLVSSRAMARHLYAFAQLLRVRAGSIHSVVELPSLFLVSCPIIFCETPSSMKGRNTARFDLTQQANPLRSTDTFRKSPSTISLSFSRGSGYPKEDHSHKSTHLNTPPLQKHGGQNADRDHQAYQQSSSTSESQMLNCLREPEWPDETPGLPHKCNEHSH